MEKDSSIGKLVNTESKAELSFAIAPSEIIIEEAFDLKIETCLGRSLPLVSYHGGGPKVLTTLLVFDKDADDKINVQDVSKFFAELATANSETSSIPKVQFALGNFLFEGYLSRVHSTHSRFNSSGHSGQLKVSLSIVASEDTHEST